VYRPENHKTEHHGNKRMVVLGPQAQAILAPFLLREPGHYLFSPAEAMAQRFRDLRVKRKTKVQPSQQDRRTRKPRKSPGDRYRVDTYGHSVERGIHRANKARACDDCKKLEPADRCDNCRAGAVSHWHVHQLRHSAATEIRRQFGLDAAQVALGHSSANITEIHAEKDLTLAEKIAREIG
jgi:integrase